MCGIGWMGTTWCGSCGTRWGSWIWRRCGRRIGRTGMAMPRLIRRSWSWCCCWGIAWGNGRAFARAEADGVQLLAPLTKDDHRRRGIDPAGTADLHRRPATARAIHALRTPHGRQQYELRGRTVEPVFGQIKNQQRARQFSRRGLRACQTEWALICTAHNLRKLHRHRPND